MAPVPWSGTPSPSGRSQAWLPLRTKLESLVECLGLRGVLAGNLAVPGVGGNERLGFARFRSIVDIQNGEIDDLVDHRTDDHGFLSAVAGSPDPAPLIGRRGRRRFRDDLGLGRGARG